MKEWQAVLVTVFVFLCGWVVGGIAGYTYPRNAIFTETIMVQENHYFIEGQEKECRQVNTELCFSDDEGNNYWVPHPTKEQLDKLSKLSNYYFVRVNNFCNKDDINLVEKVIMVGDKHTLEIKGPDGN